MNSHIRKQFLRRLPFGFYLRIYPFSPKASIRSQISYCRFHENSVIKLLHEKNGVTLWHEFTHHESVSEKASFQFLSGDISFFVIGLNVLPNIPLQFHENSISKLLNEKNSVTLCGKLTYHKTISQKASF